MDTDWAADMDKDMGTDMDMEKDMGEILCLLTKKIVGTSQDSQNGT